MRPPLVDLEEFRVSIPGGIASDDEARAVDALGGASAWARAEARQSWVDDEGDLSVPDAHDIVFTIVKAIARRVFDNPDSVTLSVIDGATEQLANASSDTYLTAGERAQLRRLRPKANLGVGTLETTRGTEDVETRVPVGGYADPDFLGSDPRGAKPMPWLGPDLI